DFTEGWIDERELLSRAERDELDESVRPVRLAILKLRKFAYAILNSTTLLLPKWFSTLVTLMLNEKTMPRDVTTRWNSTYDMLVFALAYRSAIDSMTSNPDIGL
ncbi:hypothetical protein BKA70DRAFT_1073888, partial [Coprinopsis sp. MPI-PUGE-AT-0042]